jgi:hypothetical protein
MINRTSIQCTRPNQNNGLDFTIYEGYFGNNSNYLHCNTALAKAARKGRSFGHTLRINTLLFATNGALQSGATNYTLLITGYFKSSIAGNYTFITYVCLSMGFWIGANALNPTSTNTLIQIVPGTYPYVSKSIYLDANTFYPIRIIQSCDQNPGAIEISFQLPGAATSTKDGTSFFYRKMP